ncbi:molybdopterin molybdotransferase MoeA [Pseudanabaena mucicola]|uniref:Molybdopterin molybdenumtransferase n=1 Tax=Pseudanabaena mucicola FACHB-723 TaxID=2692860 RepID=A0ABR7ZUJ1_9CYAN|nr:gephyrin-like molybdotransferase Glp [Pseudanabaena mucicola]MBD2187212.1 molybdopterin molybdotransferase MoeA [Pseudanabaena mucicola FACHB-723]
MFSVAEVEQIILNLVQPFDPELDSEVIHLSRSQNRILVEDIHSPLDFPHWHNSAMDGYALRYADLANLSELKIAIATAQIPAGSAIAQTLPQGECMRIFTGGRLPIGADTVIMQEDTEPIDNVLYLKTKPSQGEYVRHQGEFITAGTKLINAGTKIGATKIGALAAARCQQIKVYRQPKIAIISTGNELVSLDSSSPLQSGQIIDSNLHTLSALVTQSGAIAMTFGAIPDHKAKLIEVMQQAIATADLVISTGGVSVGDYDYIDELLASLGADIHVRSIAIKPGKPLTVATIGKILYFGVPGNPVSSMMSFWRFIRGAIAKLNGGNPSYWYPQFIKATTTEDLHAQGRRETYLWGHLSYQKGHPVFQPVKNYSSGNLISVIGANSLAVMRVNQTYVPAGDECIIMLI